MANIILNVKAGINLVLGEILAHPTIPKEHIFKFCAFLPNLHGACLDDLVSSITRQSFFISSKRMRWE